MSKKTKSDLFSAREIQTVLNNSVMFTASPSTGAIPEERKRRLRDYAQAGIEVILDHIEEGLLSAEEAVHVKACEAMYIHIKHVQGNDKLPASKAVKELLDK